MSYYEILNISSDADEKQIKRAYFTLALTAHPDKNPPEQKAECEKQFKLIGEAYAVLSDSSRRRAYDAALSSNTPFSAATQTTSDWESTYANFDDLFSAWRAAESNSVSEIFARYNLTREQYALLESIIRTEHTGCSESRVARAYEQFKTDKEAFKASFEINPNKDDWFSVYGTARALLRVFKDELFLNDFPPSVQEHSELIKEVIKFTPHNIKHVLPTGASIYAFREACYNDMTLIQNVPNETIKFFFRWDYNDPSPYIKGLTENQKSDPDLILWIFTDLGSKELAHTLLSEEQIQLGLKQLKAAFAIDPTSFTNIRCVELIKRFVNDSLSKEQLLVQLKNGGISYAHLSSKDQEDCDMFLAALQGKGYQKSCNEENYGAGYARGADYLLKLAPKTVINQLRTTCQDTRFVFALEDYDRQAFIADEYARKQKFAEATRKTEEALVDAFKAEQTRKAENARKVEEARNKAKVQIEEALTTLQTKIGETNQHPFDKAYQGAQRLLYALHIAKIDYLDDIGLIPIEDANKKFKNRCTSIINAEKPLLERDLGWGDFLTNLLKIIANALIRVASFGQANSFFTPVRSKSLEAMEEAEQQIMSIWAS